VAGVKTIWRKPQPSMTADDFLAWPGDGTGRTFQLVDGEVRPVSAAARIHAAVQSRLGHFLQLAIDKADPDYEVLTEAAIQPGLNAAMNVRVPDLVVAPPTGQQGDQTVPDPILVIEVLSPGNQDDTRDNVRACATLPSVQEIAVVHSTRILAEVHRRGPDGAWVANPGLVKSGEPLCLLGNTVDFVLDGAYARTYLARQSFFQSK